MKKDVIIETMLNWNENILIQEQNPDTIKKCKGCIKNTEIKKFVSKIISFLNIRLQTCRKDCEMIWDDKTKNECRIKCEIATLEKKNTLLKDLDSRCSNLQHYEQCKKQIMKEIKGHKNKIEKLRQQLKK